MTNSVETSVSATQTRAQAKLDYVMVMHDGGKATRFMSEDYCKDLMERLAAAQSREVCTAAHDDVDTCGYCQRDTLAAQLAEAQREREALRAIIGKASREPLEHDDVVLSD